jgi:NTE family protein
MAIFGKEKVVLALGGGGSRGLAHLGVLKALSDEGIPVHGIVGTSVGAIVGAAYAIDPDIDRLTEVTLGYLRSDRFQNDHFRRMMFGANDAEQNFFFNILSGIRKSFSFTNLIRKPSILDGSRLREVVNEFIEDKTFEEAEIPFAVPAIDLKQPLEVLLTSGSLRDAVLASCSLPGFFPPVEVDGMLLADVGIMGSVPVRAAKELLPGALVIAVDLSRQLERMESLPRGWDSILRAESIASRKLNSIELQDADVVVHPEVGEKYWSDFSELRRMVQSGLDATNEQIGEIRNRLQGLMRFLRMGSSP